MFPLYQTFVLEIIILSKDACLVPNFLSHIILSAAIKFFIPKDKLDQLYYEICQYGDPCYDTFTT